MSNFLSFKGHAIEGFIHSCFNVNASDETFHLTEITVCSFYELTGSLGQAKGQAHTRLTSMKRFTNLQVNLLSVLDSI